VARILVVEDDPDLQMLAQWGLEKSGHTVTVAGDGYAALQAVRDADDDFELFLLDVAMPNMTGVDLVSRLREDPATEHTPVVMLTASTGAKATERAFAAGADEYVTKPYRVKDMVARVDALLARHAAARQATAGQASAAGVAPAE
jgi:DNA-binding response OmpR family regulator